MPCETYKKLEKRKKWAFESRLQWHPENGAFRGPVSERKRKKLVKAANGALEELDKKRSHHLQSCEECNRDRLALIG